MRLSVRPLAPLALAVLAAAPAPAGAFDLEVDSETVGQGYQLVNADRTVIDRRRLDQYLGLHLWNLGPKDAFGAPTEKNQFYFTMSLRVDADFGDYAARLLGPRLVSDELRADHAEILYGYFGAKDLGGFLDARLGRQIDVDQFEFRAFDGLSLEAKTPYWFAVGASAGLLVNGALPFDSPVYRPDGTAPSALSVHDTDYKPTLSAWVRAFGFRDLDARLDYRHTWSPAQNTTPAEAAVKATDGTSEEKLSWSVRGRLLDGRLVPWFALRYDFLVGVVDNIQAGARFVITPRQMVQLEYLYSYPTFDGDSIWNLFVNNRFDDVRASYDLGLGALKLYARAFLRFFHDTVENDRILTGRPTTPPSSSIDWGGILGGRLDLPRGFVRADGYGEGGYGGTKVGVDLSSRMRVYKELIALEGRLTYVHFEDDLRPDVSEGDSFGAQLGARLQLGRGILLHLLAEENVNRFYASQLRLYAVLDLAFLLSRAGFAQGYPRGVGQAMGQFPVGGAY